MDIRKWLKFIGIDPAPYATRVMIDNVGNWMPPGMESIEDRQKRLENERYVRDERGF